MSLNLDCPRTLPVHHLSHTSIRTYLGCPERWRRRYLELEYEPTNANMTVGKVVGRSASAGFIDRLTSETLNMELITDTFDTEWKQAVAEEVDWGEEQPGAVKDSAAQSLHTYAFTLMGQVEPVAVEEGFELRLPHADWHVEGFLDVVTPDTIIDVKTSARRKTQAEIDCDTQATMYVAAKQVQDGGLRRPFKWHAIKRPSPGGRSPAEAIELTTDRTQLQINNYLEKIALVAREIDWRVETGNWQGAAPGNWMCSATGCGFWDSCPFGGQR